MKNSDSVLVTGASGFVGKALAQALGDKVVKSIQRSNLEISGCTHRQLDINASTDYGDFLLSVNTVVHCAARVHLQGEQEEQNYGEYRNVNSLGTLNLARQAAEAGVRRFIFLSTVLVNGDSTQKGLAFGASDIANPSSPFASSKMEAEFGLLEIAKQTNMEVVIIRSPLVYGKGAKANFAQMQKIAERNLPLPLGAIHNKRSLIGIDNLVHFIITCLDHPKAGNQVFLVSDGYDVSTTQILTELTIASGQKPWLIPLPVPLLKLIASILGKGKMADRLCSNLQVEISYTKQVIGWKPPIPFNEGIRRCFGKLP
ncbi:MULTISPECIES: NAD-dependent epimerase/dehydratase family protein [unclassified Oleiphilus]|uniref:NAD-dependent epimerase/dehydratase family protein n=1 Tax=unclassified Oleiphilus TaxID=2631174 RepID=UPI0018D2FB1D|nr:MULTISPECIES: NAD-dependent epimerase/dehydratase family protein [unclassified Oleiphilus]